MNKLELLSEQAPVTSRTTDHYFYLYYEAMDENTELDYVKEIRRALLKYFKNIV